MRDGQFRLNLKPILTAILFDREATKGWVGLSATSMNSLTQKAIVADLEGTLTGDSNLH